MTSTEGIACKWCNEEDKPDDNAVGCIRIYRKIAQDDGIRRRSVGRMNLVWVENS